MKVKAVQQHNYASCNRRNINFKGEFVKNDALNTLMRTSNIGGLKRFKELVQSIKKVQDNLIFWVERVESEYEIHNGSDTATDISYYLHKQSGQDKKTDKILASIYDEIPYSAKLSKVNEALEEFYKNDIPIEDKTNLMNEIEELLID